MKTPRRGSKRWIHWEDESADGLGMVAHADANFLSDELEQTRAERDRLAELVSCIKIYVPVKPVPTRYIAWRTTPSKDVKPIETPEGAIAWARGEE